MVEGGLKIFDRKNIFKRYMNKKTGMTAFGSTCC